jgi:hypothetical protein
MTSYYPAIKSWPSGHRPDKWKHFELTEAFSVADLSRWCLTHYNALKNFAGPTASLIAPSDAPSHDSAR